MSEMSDAPVSGPLLHSRYLLERPVASGGARVSRSAEGRTLPLISIVTIVYNCEKSIEGTMRSVFDQGVPNLEYIVVDGGSTDATVNVIRAFDDKLEYWASEKDKGIPDALNKGLSLARGEIVGLINSGDAYEPGALAALAALATQDKETDVFYGAVRYIRPGGGGFILYPDHSLLKDKMSLSHPGCFVRLETYRKYGVFDPAYSISTDYELLLRFCFAGAKFRPLGSLAARMDMVGISNRKWFAAIWEGALAKKRYQGTLNAIFYFIRTILQRFIVNVLESSGFTPVLDFYRKRRRRLKRLRCD
jgi:glycosyltransferase involved in cell wall biosynthesis